MRDRPTASGHLNQPTHTDIRMDEIETIALHVRDTDFGRLPDEVTHITKLFIMDLVGVAIAGSSAPGCDTIVEQMKAWMGPRTCTVIAYGLRLPSTHAAFANSTLAHALDYDDTHFPADLHATASIIPAALAVAEEKGGVSGKALIAAIAIGVDLAARLSLSLKGNMHDGWVPASIFGGFGAAASVAKLSGLGAEQIRNTFGILYGQASGIRQGLLDGALSKRMQPAFAAMQAIYAARFAQAGVSGARNIISGKYGLAALYAGGAIRKEALLEDLGRHFEITNLSFKMYPCCRGAHPSIEGVLRILKREKLDPGAVEEVEIAVPLFTYDLVGHPFQIREHPQVDAQFSIPYTVATAIMKGAVGLKDFQGEVVVNATAVHELAARVRVRPDSSLDKKIADSPLAVIRIRCKNGSEFSERIRTIRGDPQDPLSVDECVEKFRGCLAFSRKKFSRAATDKLIRTLLDLEAVEDVRQLCRLLK